MNRHSHVGKNKLVKFSGRQFIDTYQKPKNIRVFQLGKYTSRMYSKVLTRKVYKDPDFHYVYY